MLPNDNFEVLSLRMDYATIILIGVGLSMDAFAASIAHGVCIVESKLKNFLKIAFFFGFFQAVMPLLGWFLGSSFKNLIEGFDHWIAFGLLLFIGIKMIVEAAKTRNKGDTRCSLDPKRLLLLSFATSIDAFAVGVTFSFLNISIIEPVLIIGLVTFVISFIGACLCGIFDKLFGKKVEIIGGLILIGIGVKIVIEHLY